jgi:hypothetical protein
LSGAHDLDKKNPLAASRQAGSKSPPEEDKVGDFAPAQILLRGTACCSHLSNGSII